ncbi:hypothetical protein [Duganella vulcania]|uniref:Helix-turn-helix type 11 domain-containing protein n=1 Tax=Duganella vulcania TaxID=2692166 RepID=A0A845GIZ3_9BURK|nr:hypothetical protein [Duganella vulcania]MYM92629.1 hypothetical protein [Duganella vulcania]
MMKTNAHGVVQYAKADARRLFVLAAAIDSLDRPTITTLAEFTGHNKGTIGADVQKLIEQYGVQIEKDGPVFRIANWGEVLKVKGVKKYLFG